MVGLSDHEELWILLVTLQNDPLSSGKEKHTRAKWEEETQEQQTLQELEHWLLRANWVHSGLQGRSLWKLSLSYPKQSLSCTYSTNKFSEVSPYSLCMGCFHDDVENELHAEWNISSFFM